MPHPSQAKRPRGRPAQSAQQQESMQQHILAATRSVFIQRGYHGLSVELILDAANLSRPTFYKYFRNTDEAIDVLLSEVNRQLIEGMTQVTEQAATPHAKLEAALKFWRQWGDDMGDLLQPLFAELHDHHSPASHHRQQTLRVLAERVEQLLHSLNRPCPPAVIIDTLITSIEFLLYRYHLHSPRDEHSWQDTRSAMLRLIVGLLGNRQDWGMALAIADHLHIDLNPAEPCHES
jgi:TetR/AcrR family transcriptional regulator